MKEPENYLGISLGVRRLGLAIGSKAELLDWRIKGFDETYSKKKVKKIWRVIEQTILRNDIQVIGVKLPPKYSRTDGIQQCMQYITRNALEKGIILFYYDLEAIELHYLKGNAKNTATIAEAISDKYPELKREFFKLSKKCQYHIKMFEAVAAMELASLEAL